MKLSSLIAVLAMAWAETQVTAPPKASLLFKEAPVRRGPASETANATPPPSTKAEISDSETEAGFCFVCAKISVLKSKTLVEQSEAILDASRSEGNP